MAPTVGIPGVGKSRKFQMSDACAFSEEEEEEASWGLPVAFQGRTGARSQQTASPPRMGSTRASAPWRGGGYGRREAAARPPPRPEKTDPLLDVHIARKPNVCVHLLLNMSVTDIAKAWAWSFVIVS